MRVELVKCGCLGPFLLRCPRVGLLVASYLGPFLFFFLVSPIYVAVSSRNIQSPFHYVEAIRRGDREGDGGELVVACLTLPVGEPTAFPGL